MNKLIQIHKAIQEILNNCPSFDNKVYLIEDYVFGMDSIDVMYNTYYHESKILKIDKNGVYILGRNQGQKDKSKMYIHEFNGINLSKDTIDKIEIEKNKISNKLDTRVPSKDIHIGDICREFNKNASGDYYYIYIGKCELITDFKNKKEIHKEKTNVYINLYEETKFEHKINEYGQFEFEGYLNSNKNKIRFDNKIGKINKNIVDKVRSYYESNFKNNCYGYDKQVKWLD
jgi:hypothetical protein